jgi:hypothetical protein
MDQHLPVQDPPKFTQIWILCLKTNRLATLLQGSNESSFFALIQIQI